MFCIMKSVRGLGGVAEQQTEFLHPQDFVNKPRKSGYKEEQEYSELMSRCQ
jgi:hypothetical protein